MKKEYKKPVLAVGTLSVTQSIVRDCWEGIPQDQVNFNNVPDCAWDMGGGLLLFVPGTACVEDGDSFGIACYNNPGDGLYMFRS